MRVLALLMTIMIFLAGLDLCGDVGGCESDIEVERVALSKDSGGNQNTCHPFCHCTRCPFSVLIPGSHQLPPLSGSMKPAYKYHSEGHPLELSYAVWQPPKCI